MIGNDRNNSKKPFLSSQEKSMILHLWASPDTGQQFVTAILHHGQLARLTVFESWQTTIKPSGWLEVRIRTHKWKKKGISKNEMGLWKLFRHSKKIEITHRQRISSLAAFPHDIFHVFQFIYKKCIFDRKQALEKCPSTFTLCSSRPALKIMQTVGLSKKNFSLPWPKLTTVDDVTIGFFSEMFVGHRKWEKLSKFVVPFTSKQEWCFFQAENQLKRRALTLATRHLRHQNATPNIPGPSFFPNIFWYLSKSKDYINISLEFP